MSKTTEFFATAALLFAGSLFGALVAKWMGA